VGSGSRDCRSRRVPCKDHDNIILSFNKAPATAGVTLFIFVNCRRGADRSPRTPPPFSRRAGDGGQLIPEQQAAIRQMPQAKGAGAACLRLAQMLG
jgi:hypothetical protein